MENYPVRLQAKGLLRRGIVWGLFIFSAVMVLLLLGVWLQWIDLEAWPLILGGGLGIIALQFYLAFSNKKSMHRSLQVPDDALRENFVDAPLYRSIFLSSSELLFIHDKYGIIREYNPRACEVFPELARLGASISVASLLVDDAAKDWEVLLVQLQQSGRAEGVLHVATKDSAVIILDVSVRSIPSTHLFQTVMRDISAVFSQQEMITRLNKELALVVERQTEAIVSSENELRQARAIMLQKDQLAELGSLVGTLGHELATPMGIGITVVSSLHEHARQLTNSLLANTLTKQDLQAFLDSITENTILVQENLQRATELMGSLKQIAVDQAGGACRSFCVDEYLKTIARSLGPLLKRSPHEFCYSCIPDLWVEGFPGMLYQILVNLVNNALIHAFDGMPEGTKGRISADLSYEQGGLSIVVRDSGKGMDTEIASQVFTRYFTTRQGKGGSGLGLHIVESLVLEAGGTINMQTKPNEGTQFSIFLPWNQCQTP